MRSLSCLLGAALLAGCAGASRYAGLPEKNLVVRTQVSEARAVLGVHAVDSRCKLTYEGFVDLDQPVTRVGIPADRMSYLVFEFTTASFWRGQRGTVRQETLLRPRPGAVYEVSVTYKNDLYGVAIRERSARGGRAREVELTGLGACRRSGE